MKTQNKMKFINSILHKKNKIFIMILILLIFLQFQSIISTFFMGRMLDKIIEKNFSMAIKLVIASGAFSVIITIVYYIYNILTKKYESQIGYELKSNIYNTLEKVKITKIMQYGSSYLVDRVNKDVSICSNFFLEEKPALYVNIINVFIVSIFFLYTSPASLIIILILIFINFFIYGVSYKKMYICKKDEAEFSNNQINIEINWFNKINLVKRENIAELMMQDIENGFEKLFKKIINVAKTNSKYFFIGTLVNVISTLVLMLFFAFQVIKNKLTIGEFIIAFSYYGELSKYITNILNYGKVYQNYNVAADRIEELVILDKDDNGNKIIDKILDISLKDVSLQLGEVKILNNFSYKFIKGNIYLISGENGVGKSSMMDIILGVLGDYSGEIKINSTNQKEVDMRNLRSNKIAFASQNPIILEGTLEKNISLNKNKINKNFFDLDYLDNKIINDFLLSGGEKRKIVLNRAFIKDADLLIFDEPDTFLDNKALNKFSDILKRKYSEKIVIVITHNKELMHLSDKIIKL